MNPLDSVTLAEANKLFEPASGERGAVSAGMRNVLPGLCGPGFNDAKACSVVLKCLAISPRFCWPSYTMAPVCCPYLGSDLARSCSCFCQLALTSLSALALMVRYFAKSIEKEIATVASGIIMIAGNIKRF